MSAAKRNLNSNVVKSSQKGCSRVGFNYQVDVPNFVYNRSEAFVNEHSDQEINVWNFECGLSLSDVDRYLAEAKKYRYPEESARILLHYHKYNIQHAYDDLPNYQPILNTYSKLEVKRFLKCVDSRPRKNFVNVKDSFPGYRMGELHALYYAIAAPFKAIPRHNRKHERQMQSCYEKAVKCGFTASGAVPTPITTVVVDPEEMEADNSFEHYLCKILDLDRANKLIAGVRRGRSAANASITSKVTGPVRLGYGGITNGALPFGRRYLAAADITESLVGSSDHSSALESHFKAIKRIAPIGDNFDYNKFKEFITSPVEELEQKQKDLKATLASLEKELKAHIEGVDFQNERIFEGLDSFFPSKGFSSISYRWTKSELTLLVMALNEYGKNFVEIARILGTKSEGLIRDFYNKYNDVFDLDGFIAQGSGNSVKIKDPIADYPASEIARPFVAGSTVSDPSPLGAVIPPTEVKQYRGKTASLLKQESDAVSNSSVAEFEPLRTAQSLLNNTKVSSSSEALFASDANDTSPVPASDQPPVISSSKMTQHDTSKLLNEQDENQSAQNGTANKAEGEEIKKEEGGKHETTRKKKDVDKTPNSQLACGKRRSTREANLKLSAQTVITTKRRRLSRSIGDDARTHASRPVQAASSVATGSPAKSRSRVRRISVKVTKTDHQTPSKRQNHKVGTSLEKVALKRGRPLKEEREEKAASGKKGKKMGIKKPKVNTHRRPSLKIPESPTSESLKRRTRVSITTASLRFSTRRHR